MKKKKEEKIDFESFFKEEGMLEEVFRLAFESAFKDDEPKKTKKKAKRSRA